MTLTPVQQQELLKKYTAEVVNKTPHKEEPETDEVTLVADPNDIPNGQRRLPQTRKSGLKRWKTFGVDGAKQAPDNHHT